MSGAFVTISGSPISGTTDASGAFTIPIAPGTYTLAIAALGLQPATTASLTVLTGQSTNAGTIALGAAQGFTFDVHPAIASGSGTATAMVSLVVVAPAGGAIFTLTSDRASFVVPASVTVPAGRRVLTFPVTYTRVASSTWVTISATNAGVTNQTHVTLTPGPTVVSVSLAAQSTVGPMDSVFGPADLVGTVALSEPAPAGGLAVRLSSSSTSAVTVPETVLVPAGALLVAFPVHAAAVAATTTSAITASLPDGSASALLTDTTTPALRSISVEPYGRTGKSIEIQIDLNSSAPVGGALVNLTSSNPIAVAVPAAALVNAYTTTAFVWLTLGTGSASPVVVTAARAGVSRSTTITVSNTITAQKAGFFVGSFGVCLTDAPMSSVNATVYSSNPSVVSLPASATVLAGDNCTSVSASATRGTYNASVVLSGAYGGREVTILVDVAPAAAPSWLDLSGPHGGSGTGTVDLNEVAPTGGVTVLLGSSAPSVLTVPASVLVPAGTRSDSFSFSTVPVASGTFASVTATSAGVTLTRSFTVLPPMVSSLSLSPTSVPGGNTSIGTVTLNGPAPTVGYPLSLSSSSPLASVPATVTVPAGSSTATFPVTTVGASAQTNVSITASGGGSSQSATLAVNLAVPASVTFNPAAVLGGNPSTGTVTLDGAVPAAGSTVQLNSLSGSAAVPASVPIAGGASFATFPVTTSTVVQTTNAGIRASYLGFSQTGTLVVTPLPPALTSVSVDPAVVSGGLPVTGRVNLSTVAPTGGLVVTLGSSDITVATTPASVTVPANATFATFAVTTAGVQNPTPITISAASGGVTVNASFTVDPATLQVPSLSPFSLVGGTPSTGTVSLIGKAHAVGVVIALGSSDTNVATVPPNVTIPAGASSATFLVSTNAALTTGSATISATGGYRNATQSAVLTITPTPVFLASFSLSAASVVGGAFPAVVGTVTLNAAAPAGGAYVQLSSSDTSAASLQPTGNIPSGSTSSTFSVGTQGVASAAAVTISAAYNGVTKTAPMTVNPAALASLVLTPTAVAGGLNVSAVVNLNGLAPPAGAVVALSSSLPGTAGVPTSVTMPANTRSATFNVSTTPVVVSTPVVVTATYAAASVTASLSVDPIGLANVSIPDTQKAGDFSSGTVRLNGPAPPGGFTVQMTASGAVYFDKVTQAGDVPSSHITVSIPAGETYAYFELWIFWDSVGGTGIVTATLNGVTKTATMTVTPGTARFSISPSAVSRGGSALGAIVFDGYPPYTSDFAVNLSSSNAGIGLTAVLVDACPILPCGTIGTIHNGTSWSFPIGVTTSSTTGATTISAAFEGLTQTAPLSVAPSLISSLIIRPSAFPGGVSIPIVLTLDSPAPPEGALIALSSSNPLLLPAPATVTIPAGQTTLSFNVIAASVASATPVTLSATYGASAKTAPVRILVDGAARVFGTVFDATVYDHDQPLQGVTASLTTDAANTTITDAQGAFTVFVDPGTSAISLSLSGFATTALPSFTASPNGSIDTGITRLKRVLSGPMSVTGRVITTAGTAVPGATGSVEGYQGTFTTDTAGKYGFSGPNLGRFRLTFTKAGFPTRTDDTFVSFSVNISSVLYDFVLDTVARPVLAAISAGPNPVVGGTTAFLRLTLSAPAPSTPSGATVSLVFSNPAATGAYNNATIPAGALAADFSVTTKTVGNPQTTTITGFYGGVQLATTLNVIPATGVLSGLSVSPAIVFGGSPSTGTVTLDGPASAGGVVVTLSSNDTAASVPATVTVPQGGTSATFTITTSAVAATRTATIRASYGNTRTATLTVNPAPPPTLIGVAPGWVLPGDTTPVLYGSNIQAGSTVMSTGPVYSLSDLTHPICTIGLNCPTQTLIASASGGTTLAFGIPVGAATGIYYLQARSPADVVSTNGKWIAVDDRQKTYPAVAHDQHSLAKRIWPGQTVTGTLTGDVPLSDIADYNYYYFVATAGSRVSVTMQRLDTSIPFGNPASLDPQVEIVSPDGFIYENLQSFDIVPSVDYNASITDAVLPFTGMYFIAAETTRGSGDYRLTFNVNSMAPVPPTSRAVAVIGNHNTVTVNTTVKTQAQMLDPRGWPLSGADVNHTVDTSLDNHGAVEFVGGSSVTTSVDGYALANAKLTSPGKVGFSPVLLDVTLAQGAVFSGDESAGVLQGGDSPREAPTRYRPAGRLPIRIVGMSANTLSLSGGGLERFPAPEPAGRKAIPGDDVRSPRRATLAPKSPSVPTPHDSADSAKPQPSRPPVRPLSIRPLAITGCFPSVFDEAAVSAPQINPPFTVVLTDETPSTGQSTPNGAVDEIDGIHGHRIEKETRLRIDIKDSTGQTPSHPVLVSLALGGSARGTFILDPSGARIECQSASLFWHETPGANEVIGYKLGTYSHFRGVEGAAPPFKPVWGPGELLDLAISTLDASGLSLQNEYLYPVRVKPGKPDHFSCVDTSGSPCPDLLAYWSDFLKFRSGTKANGDPRFESLGVMLYSSYYLHDRYDNTVYGYTASSSTNPQPNILTEFRDQTSGNVLGISTDSTELAGYSLWVHWNDDPSMPAGRYTTTLSVNFPTDPEWSGGTVTKNVDLQFDRGTYHALEAVPGYEARLGVDDGGTPFKVAPGATTAAMPKTSMGDVQRLVLLGMTGSHVIGSWPLRVEPYEDPHTIWKQNPNGPGWIVDRTESPQDPRLETSDAPRFRLSLRDEEGHVVTEGAFRVHRCPRFDHEGPPQQSGPSGQAGRPCDAAAVPPLDSFEGVVDPVILNPSAGPNNRGYLGIELLRAPAKLGYYFLNVEPSSGDTPRYRIRLVNNQGNQPEAEYRGGNMFFLVENEIDPQAMCCTCLDGQTIESPCTASPVFAATGTYQSEATDLVLPTAGLPLQVSRKYFSSRRQSGLNGIGWSSSLQAHLSYAATSAGNVLDVQMPTGVVFRFTFTNPNGPFTPPQGRKDTLVKNPDKTFDLTLEKSRIVYHFDDKGHLVSMKDEYGNTVTIGYDASGKPTQIADASGSGRFITVSYRGDGKVDRLQDSGGRSVQYAYAADGTLTSATDPAGRLTRYTYSPGSFGPLLTQISDNWNRVQTVITYDVADRTKSYTENFESYFYTYIDSTHTRKTDSSGNSTTLAFGGSGLIVDSTPPATGGSGTNHTDYNADGSVAGTTDEMGVRTTFIYDPAGRVASVTRDATGSSPVRFEYAYDPAFPDKVTSVTPKNPASGVFDPNWQGWRYDYLANGTLNHVYRLRNDGGTTDTISTFQYDAKGRVTQQTSATGAMTDYAYSGAELSIVTQPSNSDSGTRPVTTYSNYDGAGRPRTITDPAGKDTTYTYDALGRVLTVTLPPVSGLIFTTTYSYDNFDGTTDLVFTNITDPNGKLTKLGYDEHGRLVKSIDALNNATTYTYTNDVLTSITDANDNVTSYHYDPLKRLDKTTFPDGSTESYAYRGDGLLASKTDRKRQTIAYEYDAFKRLKRKIYPNPAQAITYTYQGQRLTQVDDTSVTPSETHTFSYDTSYRVQSNTQGPRGTLNYTYTPDDRVGTMTIAGTPNVTTTQTYYADGSLNTISWSPQAGQFKYAYTPRGQYQTVTFPNGQHRDYSYDDQGRLLSLANALGATNLATYAYGYDTDWTTGQNTMLGQRVSMTANVPSQGFTNALTKYSYDPLYQLKKAEYPNVAPFSGEVDQWTYDAIGNRLTSQVNASTKTYSYEKIGANPKNAQKLLGDGTNTYTYDFNGSQTSRLGPANYGFVNDPDNRLASINGNETASYTYDYQGRRTSKTVGAVTTKYLYDGLNLVRETTAVTPTDYLFGPGIDEPLAVSRAGTITYVDVDGLGSDIGENDAVGNLTHSSIFDVWGVTRTESGTRFSLFGYTSREFAEARLWFYRARFYQPGVGRFTAADPFTYELGVDLYSYVHGHPANRVDPLGLVDAPGPWESLIPVWGSGRSAITDFECGRWGWGTLNTALAISDVFLVKSLITGAGKGLFKIAGSHSWGATRKWMQKKGWYELVDNPEGHHWLMERNQGWAQDLPEWLKNQPPNINLLPRTVHQAIPNMGRLERLSTEVPEWGKALLLSSAGHGVDAARTDNQKCGCR